MPTKTKIEWTDYTSNPIRYRTADGTVVWACEKVSAGCQNCYAEALSRRYTHRRAGDWNAATMATLKPFLDEKEVHHLLRMKSLAGKRVFIGDMTDVFGQWVPDGMLIWLFAIFALRPDVTFQVLTKRSSRMREMVSDPSFRKEVSTLATRLCGDDAPEMVVRFWPLLNVWLGVSAEDQPRADERIPDLLATPAAVRFVSAEPLIGSIDLNVARPSYFRCSGCGYRPDAEMDARIHRACKGYCQTPNGCAGAIPCPRCAREHYWGGDVQKHGLGWVIVGGESGPRSRSCHVAWIRSIVQQCRDANVPLFVKQMGAIPRVSGPMSASGEWANPCVVTAASGGTHIVLKDRKGGDPSEWAEDLRVRQFPNQVEAR